MLDDPSAIDALGADLRGAGYTVDGIAGLLGDAANEALGAGTWWPALRVTARAAAPERPLATLIRLFLLGTTESAAGAADAFPRTGLDALVAQGVLEREGDGVRASSTSGRTAATRPSSW